MVTVGIVSLGSKQSSPVEGGAIEGAPCPPINTTTHARAHTHHHHLVHTHIYVTQTEPHTRYRTHATAHTRVAALSHPLTVGKA